MTEIEFFISMCIAFGAGLLIGILIFYEERER